MRDFGRALLFFEVFIVAVFVVAQGVAGSLDAVGWGWRSFFEAAEGEGDFFLGRWIRCGCHGGRVGC